MTDGACEFCGKRTYHSRKDAKRARSRMRRPRAAQHLAAYECTGRPGAGIWHLGDLPEQVASGDMDRRDLINLPEAERLTKNQQKGRTP